MKIIPTTITPLACATILALGTVSASYGQAAKRSDSVESEKAILARLSEIQTAAQRLDPDKVFSFVLENDKGALVQNGKLFLTRKAALETTKQGFQSLQKVAYKFDQQHITLLSPTVALAVGQGSSSATTDDGRAFARSFVQSVVLVLTNGEWMVIHSHRSFPAAQ